MTTENKEELLRLYKLLWEHINKYQDKFSIIEITGFLFQDKILSDTEECNLDCHVIENRDFGEPILVFVQRMITELENEIK